MQDLGVLNTDTGMHFVFLACSQCPLSEESSSDQAVMAASRSLPGVLLALVSMTHPWTSFHPGTQTHSSSLLRLAPLVSWVQTKPRRKSWLPAEIIRNNEIAIYTFEWPWWFHGIIVGAHSAFLEIGIHIKNLPVYLDTISFAWKVWTLPISGSWELTALLILTLTHSLAEINFFIDSSRK